MKIPRSTGLIFAFVLPLVKNSHVDQLQQQEWKVTVHLWDINGTPVRPYHPLLNHTEPPRYLVGKLALAEWKSSTKDSNTTVEHPTKRKVEGAQIEFRQHFTFDLGNPHETFILVEQCRSCSCPTLPDGTQDCCAPPNPDFLTGAETFCLSVCWPSHPGEILPESKYRRRRRAPCFGDAPSGPTLDSSLSSRTLSIDSYDVSCMQCFDNGDHSRSYVPSEADHLVFVDDGFPSFLPSSHVIQLKLPGHFSFGALVRTMPLIDRVWSNFGIGYNSSFLQQMNITSMLFHLQIPNHDDNDARSKSYIIFNPMKERYAESNTTKVVPFELDSNHRRVHRVQGFTTGSSRLNPSPNQNDVLFHVDTGNNGISINDTTIYDYLASATGGKWHVEDKRAKDVLMTDMFDDAITSNFEYNRLYVPFHPFNAPVLNIWLNSDVVVEIAGNSWVLSSDGETIFSTYTKNVLGLPLLASSNREFVFDDANRLLYVVEFGGSS